MMFALAFLASLSAHAALPTPEVVELPAQSVARMTHGAATLLAALERDVEPGAFARLRAILTGSRSAPDVDQALDQEAPDAAVAARPADTFEPLDRFPGFDQPWHDAHDVLIQRVVSEFNAAKGWDEGHPHHLDANLVKAWALQESGGHREIFSSGDMLQMNNRGDWAPEKEWFGVRKGERLTPERSLRAGLDWAYYKGESTRPMRGGQVSSGWHPTLRGDRPFAGYESQFTGWSKALRDYNGGGVRDYWGDIARRLAGSRSAT